MTVCGLVVKDVNFFVVEKECGRKELYDNFQTNHYIEEPNL